MTRGPRVRLGDAEVRVGRVAVRSLPQDTPQAVEAATARCSDLPCGPRCELEVAGESSSRGQEVGPVLRTPLALLGQTRAGSFVSLPRPPLSRGR